MEKTETAQTQAWSPAVKRALEKYKLIGPDGSLKVVDLVRPMGNPLGKGPKLDMPAIQRLIKADSTPNQEWIDWIFFEAGGGKQARDIAKRLLEQIRDRFIEERVAGYEDTDTHEKHAPLPKDEVEKLWTGVEPGWKAELESSDQDIVEHLGVFGYYRSWPGRNDIYKRVVKAVSGFQSLKDKAVQMNEELLNMPDTDKKPKVAGMNPSDYKDVAALEDTVQTIKRYFASKVARNDIQVESVYEDQYIKVICPLTHAASVRYGCDTWSYSSVNAFEETLSKYSSYYNPWKSTVESNILVFLHWKIAMPSWISRTNDKFVRYDLTNLALHIKRTDPASRNSEDESNVTSPDDEESGVSNTKESWRDEEGTEAATLERFKTLIKGEPTRTNKPEDEEMPIKRGPNAYSSADDANLRLDVLSKAYAAIQAWKNKFDPKRIKPVTLELDEADAEK